MVSSGISVIVQTFSIVDLISTLSCSTKLYDSMQYLLNLVLSVIVK